jgi:hypothetical protein
VVINARKYYHDPSLSATMKTVPAPTLNPAEILILNIHSLRQRIEKVIPNLESLPAVSPAGIGEALPGLEAGLRVQVVQLEYFASLSPEEIPEDWLLFIDAIELQASWLADRAQRMRPLSPALAVTLRELAWGFSALMAPMVAARLWLNARKSSEALILQSPAEQADLPFRQTAA